MSRINSLLVPPTDNLADDVPRSYLRPPTSGWQGSSAIPCQNQGVCARSFENAIGIGVKRWNYFQKAVIQALPLEQRMTESSPVYFVQIASFATVVMKSEHACIENGVERAMEFGICGCLLLSVLLRGHKFIPRMPWISLSWASARRYTILPVIITLPSQTLFSNIAPHPLRRPCPRSSSPGLLFGCTRQSSATVRHRSA